MTLESNNLFVFPCVSRATSDEQKNLEAKLMSEQNIVNIIKSITDKSSYIISWEDELVESESGGPTSQSKVSILKCVIGGYYFEITDLVRQGTKRAKLKMSTTSPFPLLSGDTGGVFQGLEIEDLTNDSGAPLLSIPDDTESVNLVLCINGEIPHTSFIKYKNNSVEYPKVIDSGELK